MRYHLAIDIGASSGRHIVGWREDGALHTREVYRFPNGVAERDGHLIWDVDALLWHVRRGVAAAREAFPVLASLAIDTWGVDYVLLRGTEEVRPAYAYRDTRTERVTAEVHARMPFSELYRRTGCQFQPFNSIYQLYCDQCEGRLEGVTDCLMLPEYLLWKLSGAKAREYTNATTTGLVNAETRQFDAEILSALGLPAQLFPKLLQPGAVIGAYEGIPCVLCATHDTASAVEGIPMEGNQPYISSGTWSLLGIKTEHPITNAMSELANWSNEGGVGYNRYQKNIMGMWLVNRLREELCPETPFAELMQAAEQSGFEGIVPANAPAFLAPASMKEAFDAALGVRPQTIGDYFRCAYRSLALCYVNAIDELQHNTGLQFDRLYVVGGGAKNAFLNRLTAQATGKQVIALPIEATALGNLKVQMEAIR